MARFDARISPSGDNGEDFQKFVWEALRTECFKPLLGTRYVRPSFARGRDGAIDHIAIGRDDQIVIECKFFAETRNGSPSQDWVGVETSLRRNLKENAANAAGEIALSYQPWFDRSRPINGYWFCTSGQLSSGAQTVLRTRIKEFFSEIAVEHSCLAHLATLEVEVIDWDQFDGAIYDSPALNFSWFRRLPNGLRPLTSLTAGKKFRKFLQEDALPFFSRRAYNFETKTHVEITDEQGLFSQLNEGEHLGLVLTGPGGAGKTRLAIELGREAEQHGWFVLRVDTDASSEAIEEIARQNKTSGRVLFIIDYAEATKFFSEVAMEIRRVNDQGGHQFRFVSTCRSSALSSVREELDDINYKVVEFAGKKAEGYANWVISKIISTCEIPNVDEVVNVCAGIPVLAAFAVFLFREHRNEFNIQFSQIHSGDDFAQWNDKRLILSFRSSGLDIRAARRALAAIAATLPFSAEEYFALRERRDARVDHIDILLADRWVEPDDEGGLCAAHDIFADALISLYAFESAAVVTDRVADILCDAAVAGKLGSGLISINRLAIHPRYAEIDGVLVARRLFSLHPEAFILMRSAVIRSRLPDERAAIRIIHDCPELAASAAADRSCDLDVSLLAVYAANETDDTLRDFAIQVLAPCLDEAVKRCFPISLVARRALFLLPMRYKHEALSWIDRLPDKADYIIKVWLDAGGDFETVQEAALDWFKSHATKHEAVYLLKYLVKEEGLPIDLVDDMIGWCARFSTDLDAIHRLIPLLKNYGDGPLELMLIEVALLVLEDVTKTGLQDKFQIKSVLHLLGWLCSKVSARTNLHALRSLDLLHTELLLETNFYVDNAVALNHSGNDYAVLLHVADLIERNAIVPDVDGTALEKFGVWIRSRLFGEAGDLGAALSTLENVWKVPGQWRTIKELEALQVGSYVTGTIKTIEEYGVFVDIGFTVALLHISETDPESSEKVESNLQLSQQITARVIRVSLEQSRVWLSLKNRRGSGRDWLWKDSWFRDWKAADDDPAGRHVLRKEAEAWLRSFVVEQGGWTSVWKILWRTAEQEFRAPLIDVAEQWLERVDPNHPRWPSVWITVWGDRPFASSTTLEKICILARNWFARNANSPDWDIVWIGLWEMPECRDELAGLAEHRLLLYRPKRADWIEEQLLTNSKRS